MYNLIKKIMKPVSVSGREDAVVAVLAEEMQPYVDSMRIDALGNLIAFKAGCGKKKKGQKVRVTKGASNDLYLYKSLVGELPNPPVHFLREKMIVLDKSAAARFFKTLIWEKTEN